MFLMVPASAATAPGVVQVDVTVTVPEGGILTFTGSAHCIPLPSRTIPAVMRTPTSPLITRSAVEFVAPFLVMPLIFTLLESARPTPVDGEKEL